MATVTWVLGVARGRPRTLTADPGTGSMHLSRDLVSRSPSPVASDAWLQEATPGAARGGVVSWKCSSSRCLRWGGVVASRRGAGQRALHTAHVPGRSRLQLHPTAQETPCSGSAWQRATPRWGRPLPSPTVWDPAPRPEPSPNVPSSPQTARLGSRGGAGAASVTHSLPPRDRHTLVVTSATRQDAPRLQP